MENVTKNLQLNLLSGVKTTHCRSEQSRSHNNITACLTQPRPESKPSTQQYLVQCTTTAKVVLVYLTILLSVWPQHSCHQKACPVQNAQTSVVWVPHLRRTKTNWAQGQIYSWVEQQATSALCPNSTGAGSNKTPCETAEDVRNTKVHRKNLSYLLLTVNIIFIQVVCPNNNHTLRLHSIVTVIWAPLLLNTIYWTDNKKSLNISAASREVVLQTMLCLQYPSGEYGICGKPSVCTAKSNSKAFIYQGWFGNNG